MFTAVLEKLRAARDRVVMYGKVAWGIFQAMSGRRPPDFVIGHASDPYMRRWFLTEKDTPERGLGNNFLHQILRDDDDRAKHDHPWASVSVILKGGYVEYYMSRGVERKRVLRAGRIVPRSASFTHRLELLDGKPVWTLFITGRKIKEWGFFCPQGWVHWRVFCNEDGSLTSRGCGETGEVL